MMAASTDRSVRKSMDKSPSRTTEGKKEAKHKENAEEKNALFKEKEKEKEREKKPEDFSDGPDKREKSPVKRTEAGARVDGKAEAKVSPMRSNTGQASPIKQTSQPDASRMSSEQQYSPVGTGGPSRGPGHWVQGMVSPPKPVTGVRDHSQSSGMKSPEGYDQRPMVMSSPSPDVQMMSPPMNYPRYAPMPNASPEVQVVEVQRTGYYQGYPPPPRQQYPGYDRHQNLGSGYHQGLPPPAHYYPLSRGGQGAYAQPPGQYHHAYGNANQQSSPGQAGGTGNQNGIYPLPPSQHHTGYPSPSHHHQSRSQPPPAHQHRQQPPYLDPQQQSSHGYGALHSMQQRYAHQPGGPTGQVGPQASTNPPPPQPQPTKQQRSHPHPPPVMFHQPNSQMSPGQQQMSPGQMSNRSPSQHLTQQQQQQQPPPPPPQPQQQQPPPPAQGGGAGGGSCQQSASGCTTSGSSISNGSSSSGSSSSSSSGSNGSAGGASGSSSTSGAAGAGTQNSNTTTNNSSNSTGPSDGSVADSSSSSSSAGGGGGSAINEFSSGRSSPTVSASNTTYPYPHGAVVPAQGSGVYPYAGSMSSASSYRVMLSRGPFNTSAFTSPPGFHHSYGYYQTAGPMMQALGEACCLQPIPYHFHQQQVKVLVHNPILPSLHPFGSSLIEMPRETKPSALVSPHRLVAIGPGGDDVDNESQQQQQQSAHVQSQQGLHSPQQPPDGAQQGKGDVQIQEVPDQKSDIKEPGVVIGSNNNNNNEEDKKATKRCHGDSADKNVVCKTEYDKKKSEPSPKSLKLSKDSSRNNPLRCEDGNLAASEESTTKNSKNEAKNSGEKSDSNGGDKKKKVKTGEKLKKSKKEKGDKLKEKKKKKKEKTLNTDGTCDPENMEKKKKKKKRCNNGEDADKSDKSKKTKKKKKKSLEVSNGAVGTSEAQSAVNPKDSQEKIKKKKKKSKDKKDGSYTGEIEEKPKKKKVVSSKKKFVPANPDALGKGQEKNVAKGTKSEAKAKKAGTATTCTKAEQESVSPHQTVVSCLSNSKTQTTGLHPPARSSASPNTSKATKNPEPTKQSTTVSAPSQGSCSPLAAVSSLKAVSSNPKGMTSLSIDVRESESSKAKSTARKTPSPGKSASIHPLQPPAKLPGRKTPSPGGKTAAAKVQQNPAKINVDAIVKGVSSRKTPSPANRKTPSPSTRATSSPGVRKTSSPSVGRKTPSPNVSRKTPSPNVARKTPSPKTPTGKTGPAGSPKPIPGPKPVSSSPNVPQSFTNPKGTVQSGNKGTVGKSSSSKDGRCVKPKVEKSPGATKRDKTPIKAKGKKTLRLLSPEKAKERVTKKIKKKNLQLKKLKAVIGKAKGVKLSSDPLKKSPSPPKAKSPIQAIATCSQSQSSRGFVPASPKKLTPSPSAGKPRPRIDDIARRLSIENRDKISGKESPALKEGNGRKERGSDSRRNSRDKEERKLSKEKLESSRGMRIKMVPVVCPWSWKGEAEVKQVSMALDAPGVNRKCYPAIRHKIDGDVINVRDCVLVSSGHGKSDVPYVAKIAALWENEQGDMMMSLLWYYRPEHTESDRLPRHIGCEIFASKHWDQISVACIDDKCHVLTFNEYCRFKANQKQHMEGIPLRVQLVPGPEDQPAARRMMPDFEANPETVFLCRRVYDFKMKRILKNPT